MVFYILPSIFVTKTCLGTKVTEVTSILTITCEDRVLILIIAASRGIIDVLQIVLRVRSSIMELEFTTQAQSLANTKRHRIVELESVVQSLILIL